MNEAVQRIQTLDVEDEKGRPSGDGMGGLRSLHKKAQLSDGPDGAPRGRSTVEPQLPTEEKTLAD